MEILGYSERGVLYSLIYEISFSENSLRLLEEFLSLATFPYRETTFQLSGAEVLIEQSFSEFGVPDLIALIHNTGRKQVVFVEAKTESIYSEFEKFKAKLEGGERENIGSLLPTQLYYKTRLIDGLRLGGIRALKNSVRFSGIFKPKDKPYRTIGNNEIVLKAAAKVMEYSDDALFIALTPDEPSILKSFFEKLKNFSHKDLHGWKVDDWGYMSWKQVEEFCKRNKLMRTLRVFDWNRSKFFNGMKGGKHGHT